MPKVQSCGMWKSPITADLILTDSVKFQNISSNGTDIYFLEIRPNEKGRYVVVKYHDDSFEEMTPKPYNVRSRVHEYGGLSFLMDKDKLYFSNFDDQHVYVKDGEIKEFVKKENSRFIEFVKDETKDLIFAIQEEHLENDVINTIVKIDNNGTVEKVVEGRDFYSSITISPNGKQIAFLCWNQPYMPWDAAEVWLGDLTEDGKIINLQKIAGSDTESIFQPRFSKDNVLYFISDRTNWWNLYRLKDSKIEAICPMDAEFGYPQWLFGFSKYDFYYEDNKTYIIAAYGENAKENLIKIDPENKYKEDIKTNYTSFNSVLVLNDKVLFIGSSNKDIQAIVSLDLKTNKCSVIKKSIYLDVDPGYFSLGEDIEFPTEDNKTAHMIYYPPKNKDYVLPSREKPPLMVLSHGGPTSQRDDSLNLSIQYWTSRGFAVADVNYGGSTGYGRKYRERLNGNWGIVDIDDCTNAALFLVEKGLVDENRLIIKGGSAGGYTTLGALVYKDVFKAGASYYGVSDIEALVKDTHKFEAKYEEMLIGPYPEEKQKYFDRSPINFIDQLSCPLILLQGDEDKIVPPSQSEEMFKVLKDKNIPVSYLLFEKEQHGFRNSENIKRSLEAELYFYSKVFHFDLIDEIEPIEIENLELQ